MNNLILHLIGVEKEQTNPKASRRKKIKIGIEIKEVNNRKIEKINKTRSLLFGKKKRNWHLARLTNEKREKLKFLKWMLGNSEIKRIIKICYEQVYTKLYTQMKWTNRNTQPTKTESWRKEKLNKPTTSKEI